MQIENSDRQCCAPKKSRNDLRLPTSDKMALFESSGAELSDTV